MADNESITIGVDAMTNAQFLTTNGVHNFNWPPTTSQFLLLLAVPVLQRIRNWIKLRPLFALQNDCHDTFRSS